MTDPAPETPRGAELDPGLLPFLPLIYVAWADGHLTDPEIEMLRERMEGAGVECREPLRDWLDPAAPPSPARLQDVLAFLRERADELDEDRRRSLAGLGLEIAELTTGERPGTDPEATERALHDIEAAMGVVGAERARELLEPEERAPAPPPERPRPGFDVPGMTRFLDGEHREIRNRVREILREGDLHTTPELLLDPSAYREQTLAWCRRLADEGLGGLAFPEGHGGGGDLGAFVSAFETLAWGDLSLLVKFGVQFGLFGGSIQMLGTEKHHEKYLRRVASLDLPGCFAMSETGHGSNVRDVGTTATYDAETDEIVIDTPFPAARKDWIGNAARHGRLATVFAQLEVAGRRHGVHAILVPIRDEAGEILPGVAIEDCGLKEGLNGVDNGRISFDHVRVPRENLLDRYGRITEEGKYESPIRSDGKRFFTMLGTLVGGRISVGGAAIAASKIGLAIAIRYGAARRQFGPAGEPEMPILDYPAHQRRLLPRLATLYALDSGQKHLRKAFVARSEEDARKVEALAAGLKAWASWFAVETLQTCRECCGGQGYLLENRFSVLKDDTDVFTTFEGDNTVLLQLVARSRLTDFRDRFGENRFVNTVKYIGEQASTVVTELNPIVTRKTDPEHLRSADFHLGAFQYREERILAGAAQHLRQRIKDGEDSFTAALEIQSELLRLAKAHVERVVLETFRERIDACEEADLRGVLETISQLFALSRIEADAAWFLAHGYLESSKAKAVEAQVDALCRDLRPHAVPLVDAFGIPDECVRAPIAFRLGASE